MGLFDFIGDAFGAITAPFTAVIDAGTRLLGLPPVIGDALKVAVGAATGDFVTLLQGSAQLLKDLAASAAATRSTTAFRFARETSASSRTRLAAAVVSRSSQ